jgi:hypothetical protein
MNIRYLHQLLSRINEITVIGKNAEVDGVLCHVIGVVRYGMQMRLLVLQYDGAFQQHVEETGAADLCGNLDMAESNRIVLRGGGKFDSANPFRAVRKVFISESEFEVHSSEHQRLSIQGWEPILILSEFLRHGWQPDGMDFQSIDMLFLASLELNGDYTAIPAFGENPELRFTMGPDSVSYLVEQPITLTVGGEYQGKLRFKDVAAGEEHWAQINRVYLSNIWEDMGKIFADSKMQEQMTPEQIAQAKSHLDEQLLEICPKGMCFPIIEYECEEGISLNFYSKAYLDAVRVRRRSCSSIGFIVRPDQPTGILGLKLKAAVIQEPVPGDTVCIEAELFQYIHTTTGGDIVLK